MREGDEERVEEGDTEVVEGTLDAITFRGGVLGIVCAFIELIGKTAFAVRGGLLARLLPLWLFSSDETIEISCMLQTEALPENDRSLEGTMVDFIIGVLGVTNARSGKQFFFGCDSEPLDFSLFFC